MNRYSAVMICGLALTGCVPPPTQPPAQQVIQNSRVYNTNFDTAWGHLVQFFPANNIQLKTIDKASGVIYAEKILGGSEGIVECGEPGIMSAVTVGTVNVLVTAEGGKTKVTVNLNFNQTRRLTIGYGTSTMTVKCSSTGFLEQQILDAI